MNYIGRAQKRVSPNWVRSIVGNAMNAGNAFSDGRHASNSEQVNFMSEAERNTGAERYFESNVVDPRDENAAI